MSLNQTKANSFTAFSTKELPHLAAWILICLIIGTTIGSVIALFLYGLEFVTDFRIQHPQIIWALPIAGFFIGWLYLKYGQSVKKGNDLILEQYHNPTKPIHWIMAPLILIGTWITHLFGGSAGREGTAIQIGSSLAEQLALRFKTHPFNRKTILQMGIASGFAAVFGTPLAGILFSIEIVNYKIALNIKNLLAISITSFIAHYVTLAWSMEHTLYTIEAFPEFSLTTLGLPIGCGILFGLTARVFILTTQGISKILKSFITYPALLPVAGAILFLLLWLAIADDRFLGLGIATIQQSFLTAQNPEVFLLKILFTAIILGSGFKGGEVTPLFFIGATLGSMLSTHTALPISFLAALGFIGVFAGATKTPIACALMGIELFGTPGILYFLLVCLVSYLTSGPSSIYNSQNHIHFWQHISNKIGQIKNTN